MRDEIISPDDHPVALLVEVEPGLACLFGEAVPDGVDVIRPVLMPASATSQITSALGSTAATFNVGAQAAQAASGLQGLVQLTPATMQALQTAAPMTSGGVNLGSLVDASGQIVHSVQWVPAGAAGAAAGIAAVGPAVALLAIQVQLTQISALANETLALTDELLRAVRIERWAEVTGLQDAMLRSVDEARHVGAVTEPIWRNVSAQEPILGKVRAEFREKVDTHVKALSTKSRHSERREFLTHNGEAILQDAQALIRAQAAWFTYQAIRAGDLYERLNADPTAERLLEKVVKDARREHEQSLWMVGQLLDALHWQLSLMAELPGRQTLPLGKEKRAAKDVTRASRLLLDQLSHLGKGFDLSEPEVQTPPIAAFKDEIPDVLPRVLRWHLKRGERLLALAEAKGTSWPVDDGAFLAVTDQSVLVADKGDLEAKGEVRTRIPLAVLRHVRFTPAPDTGRRRRSRLDITTPDFDVNLTFAEWASEDHGRAELQRLAQLLRSSMRLPPDEIPESPLPLEPSDRRTEQLQ